MSLYENINKRKKAGTSRSKKKSTISTKLPFFEKEKSEVLFKFESKTITNPWFSERQFFIICMYLGSKIWSDWILPGSATIPKGKTGKLFFFKRLYNWIEYFLAVLIGHQDNNIII